MGLSIDELIMSDENGVEWTIKIVEGKIQLQHLTPDEVDKYVNRNENRKRVLNTATISFIGYLISVDNSADSDEIKIQNAEIKATLLSRELKADIGQYQRGDTQLLIDGINASNLNFMDENAKTYLINLLMI